MCELCMCLYNSVSGLSRLLLPARLILTLYNFCWFVFCHIFFVWNKNSSPQIAMLPNSTLSPLFTAFHKTLSLNDKPKLLVAVGRVQCLRVKLKLQPPTVLHPRIVRLIKGIIITSTKYPDLFIKTLPNTNYPTMQLSNALMSAARFCFFLPRSFFI